MTYCIYCRTPNLDPSSEHVIADGLGGTLALAPEHVCKSCNNALNEAIDRPILADLLPILAQLRVDGKRGNVPRWVVTETIDGEPRRFEIDQTSVRPAEKRKLLSRSASGYEFRADSAEQLQVARAEIARKHPSRRVELTEIINQIPKFPEQRIDEIDFSLKHWSRWAAKTCVNVICFALGSETALSTDFDDLRDHARYGSPVRVGLDFGGLGATPAEIETVPATHRILIKTGGGEFAVQVKLFDFCGCLLRRKTGAIIHYQREITLDASGRTTESDSSRS